MQDKLSIRIADWQNPADQQALKRLRKLVFIDEQQVPASLEWDGEDSAAIHLLVNLQTKHLAVACARLLISSNLNQNAESSGKIGRMAVLSDYRKQGIGLALLQAALAVMRAQSIAVIRLSAQKHAIGFYQKAGFSVCSATYLDASIPHVDMQIVNRQS